MEPSTRTGAIVFTLIAVFMYWLAFDQRESGDIWFWIINIAAGSTIKALGLWIKGHVQRTNPGNDRKVCFHVSSAVLAGLILLVIPQYYLLDQGIKHLHDLLLFVPIRIQ